MKLSKPKPTNRIFVLRSTFFIQQTLNRQQYPIFTLISVQHACCAEEPKLKWRKSKNWKVEKRPKCKQIPGNQCQASSTYCTVCASIGFAFWCNMRKAIENIASGHVEKLSSYMCILFLFQGIIIIIIIALRIIISTNKENNRLIKADISMAALLFVVDLVCLLFTDDG